ncbi:MAG: hypothetical protein RJA70_1177 [Pseudomonadota bacterium]|jgi:exopolyphosphatase/guanosine-5'-triphosphate,3'-diphosphate pyrophosphatase
MSELAAVDLGSNSFHMVIARDDSGRLSVLDRLRDPVRLLAGVNAEGALDRESEERALGCLRRFGERIRHLPRGQVKAVGTSTLRTLSKNRAFLRAAEAALGHPIRVISGKEEARLIFVGVAQALGEPRSTRLVFDVGGGSTEVILGEGFTPEVCESIQVGCVSHTQRFFAAGKLTREAMTQAELAAEAALERTALALRGRSWDLAVGASGTINAIGEIAKVNEWTNGVITANVLDQLRRKLLEAGRLDRVRVNGLSPDRAPVIAGGLAIVHAIFRQFRLTELRPSASALREGVLYELAGKTNLGDLRANSVSAICRRFGIDTEQGARVEKSAVSLWQMVRGPGAAQDFTSLDVLRWAARLHELGLCVAYGGYHKHGAYVIEHADLPGFSWSEQRLLSTLVRWHRRKLSREALDETYDLDPREFALMIAVLRLAVLLNRHRENTGDEATATLTVKGTALQLHVPTSEDTPRSLLLVELTLEAEQLTKLGWELAISV